MPSFRKEGEDYISSWDDPPYELVFNRVRTTDTRATAWVNAFGLDSGVRRPIMAPLSMALTETAGRERLIKHLESRTTVTAKVWAEWVEQAINRTLLAVFEPEPLVNLAEVELREDQGYLIENLLPLGELTVLLADQGSSKSYLLLYLLTCIALDLGSIFGRPNACGPVMFLDTETSAEAHRRRLERIARGMNLVRLPDILYRRLTGRLIDSERQIRAEVARIKPVALGLDSLTYASGGNLNDSESAGATINLIADLPDFCTKLATAHHAKQARGQRLEDASVIGSSLFEFKASARWVLRRETEDIGEASDFNVLMRNLKMRDGRLGRDLVYNLAFDNIRRRTLFTRGSTANMGSLDRNMPARERIRTMLAKAPAPLKVGDLSDRLELAVGTVKKELNYLAEKGQAVNVNRSGGGTGNAGLWVMGSLGENRSGPIDKSIRNGSLSPDGENRSSEPFRTVPGSRMAASGEDPYRVEELPL